MSLTSYRAAPPRGAVSGYILPQVFLCASAFAKNFLIVEPQGCACFAEQGKASCGPTGNRLLASLLGSVSDMPKHCWPFITA